MPETTYRSRCRVEKVEGVLRRAHLPGEDEPVLYGIHSEIAEHYGMELPPGQTRAATLDHVVAAAAG